MGIGIREVVAVFHDEQSLQHAVDDLMIQGFDRSSCSVLAGRRTVEKAIGHYFGRVAEIEDDPDVPHASYQGPRSRVTGMGAMASGLVYVGAVASVGAIVATGGTATAALIGAVLVGGAGGLIGTALSRVIGARHEQYLRDQLERGGLILWVRAESAAQEQRASAVLRAHAADDVHGHDVPATRWTRDGGVSYALSFMNRLGL
jgi:hypothetical protein